MSNYGNPYGYSAPSYATPHVAGQGVQAKISMPDVADMGGKGQVPWVRFPYYPTAPFYSTDPNIGYQTRFYGATLLPTDADFALNQEALRNIQFDIPVRMIAINGAAVDTTNLLTVNEGTMNLQYLFRIEYTTGDQLMTAARLATTVVGTQSNPGELGGTGYTIDQGGSLTLGITPLRVNTRIDITLVCLEMRGRSNLIGR